jgi:hypothetical protein
MKYIVVSELVGTPGDVFTPKEGVNVQALLDGGFIKADTKKAKETSED